MIIFIKITVNQDCTNGYLRFIYTVKRKILSLHLFTKKKKKKISKIPRAFSSQPKIHTHTWAIESLSRACVALALSRITWEIITRSPRARIDATLSRRGCKIYSPRFYLFAERCTHARTRDTRIITHGSSHFRVVAAAYMSGAHAHARVGEKREREQQQQQR